MARVASAKTRTGLETSRKSRVVEVYLNNEIRFPTQPTQAMKAVGLVILASLSRSCAAFAVVPLLTAKPFQAIPVLSCRHRCVSAHVASRHVTRIVALASPPTADGDPEKTIDDSSSGNGSQDPKPGLRKRLSSYFKSSDKDDGLTFRQRLAKMGLATVLSYGWISNTNAMILLATAWYVFCAKVRTCRCCRVNFFQIRLFLLKPIV